MTSSYKYLILCLGLFLQYSCGNSFYNPINEVPVSPSQKGELYTNVGILHTQRSLPQFSLSYSPINRLGVAYNGVYGKNYMSNTFLLGSYHSFLKTPTSARNRIVKKKSFIDLYFGYGFGNSNLFRFYNNSDLTTIKAYGNFKKIITQAAYHYHKNSFGFDFGIRYGKLDFTKLTIFEDEKLDYKFFLEQDPFDLLESHINLNFGKENFKIMVGVNYRQKLIDQYSLFYKTFYPEDFNRITVYSSVGINLRELKSLMDKKKKRRN